MSKIVAITNQKGGVGKTTSTINLASYIAAMGKRVLILDIDPQGNASSGLGVDKKNLSKSIYHLLMGEVVIEEVIIPTSVKGLDIVPTSIELVGAEVELIGRPNRDNTLKNAVAHMRNSYDFIFIDCPPSLGLLTVNALTASDTALIPIQGEFFALEGLSQLLNTIKLVKKHYNFTIEIEGVLLTMFDGRSNLANSVAAEIHKYFGKKVFDTKIPRSVRLAEAPSYGIPVMQFDPRSAGALAYKRLAEEFLHRNGAKFTRISKDMELKLKQTPPAPTK